MSIELAVALVWVDPVFLVAELLVEVQLQGRLVQVLLE